MLSFLKLIIERPQIYVLSVSETVKNLIFFQISVLINNSKAMYAFRNIDFSFLKTYGVGLFRVESKELDASESVPVSEVFID